MKRVAIIAAMPGELKPFLDANAKEGWTHERRGNVKLWRLIWSLDQGEWIAACAGAGEDAATRAFAEVEKDGPVSRVISTGWAGALSEVYQPGQAYHVSEVIDARTGERFAADSTDRFPRSQNRDLGHPGCSLVTSPTVADYAEKRRLAATYEAGMVDMEAAGLARLAAMRGIPFYCVKGVSDGYSDKLPDFNRFISTDGQFRLVRFVVFALFRPWRWPALMRMGENSTRAAQAMAALLFNLLNE
jgi:adenosylhomocysteine nucleosidase